SQRTQSDTKNWLPHRQQFISTNDTVGAEPNLYNSAPITKIPPAAGFTSTATNSTPNSSSPTIPPLGMPNEVPSYVVNDSSRTSSPQSVVAQQRRQEYAAAAAIAAAKDFPPPHDMPSNTTPSGGSSSGSRYGAPNTARNHAD